MMQIPRGCWFESGRGDFFEMKLEELAKEISKCRKCRLWKTRKHAVPGEGNAKAEIMIIGQAPGKKEDATGRPFVGRAGRFLTSTLEQFGKQRNNFFITSIVKCFPLRNRKPRQDEIATCLPYTLAQIETIKPKAVLLLGEIATKALLSKELKTVRGKFFEKNGILFFSTYHPSAVMRFKKLQKEWLNDLKQFFRKLKKS